MMDPKIRVEELCKHELGHWFMSKKYNFNAESITIRFNEKGDLLGGSALSFPFPDLPDKNSILNYLKKRYSVLMAGIITETYKKNLSGDDCQKYYDNEKNGDVFQADALLHIARGIQFSGKINDNLRDKQLDIIHKECDAEVLKYLEIKFDLICFMSKNMADEVNKNFPMRDRVFKREDLISLISQFNENNP